MKITDKPTDVLGNTFRTQENPNWLLITWTITENHIIFDYFGL